MIIRECSWLRSAYSRKIDAGLILLSDPRTEFGLLPAGHSFGLTDLTDWRAEVLGPDGSDDPAKTLKITGDRTLALTDLQAPSGTGTTKLSLVVQKYGIRTRFTAGIVRCIEYTSNATTIGENNDPAADGHIYILPYNESTGAVEGDAFGRQGDSGSAVLDKSGKIIGLFSQGPGDELGGTGLRSSLVPISIIKDRLHVQVMLSDSQDHTIPTGNFVEPTQAGPYQAPSRYRPRRLPNSTADSPIPARALAMLRRSMREIKRMVRNDAALFEQIVSSGGLSIASSLARSTRDPSYRIPATVQEKSTERCLDEVIDIILHKANGRLRSDLEALRPLLTSVSGETFRDIQNRMASAPWR